MTRLIHLGGCVLLFLLGCGQETVQPCTEIVVSLRALPGSELTGSSGRLVALQLNAVSIGLADFELKSGATEGGGADSLLLDGLFEVSLLTLEGFEEVPFLETCIPALGYSFLNFRMDSTSLGAKGGSAFFVSGEYNEQPFTLRFNSPVQVTFTENNLALMADSEGPVFVKLYFNLGDLFNPEGGLDLSMAEDRNNDGLIAIGAGDEDGNGWMMEVLEERLGNSFHLLVGK